MNMNDNSRQGISSILETTRTELKNKITWHSGSNSTHPAIIDEVNDILERMAVLRAKIDQSRTDYQFQNGQKNHQFKNQGQAVDLPIEYRINSDGGAIGV